MILFHINTANLKISNRRAIKKWIGEIIKSYGMIPGDIGIIFCESEYLLKMNKKYLGHDHYTDVITFSYTGKNETKMSGDIFIDVETVRNNALLYGQSFSKELLRVMAHGVLHILGEDDITTVQSNKMRKAEDNALSKIKIDPII
ncbi:MAG: rRNA maturation RNase YbeY [Bacteroidales bacterium]|jgi:rRNA maturation RNase YbeY|nr:rRNA maturation RNase YbeY [Bacteroidales bacterium]MDD2263411.1 rRNA maturation RNase YbeY [Bacteroidales bacterium]MDD2830799.1 rRNA maturation RNase YbeY [Bacteroidales bacterium]MDD3207998.1 rRNA maturation RNase YbeY [Bacteroidales bacterium]MDD3696495.1 rRNA maturation RNase YbeY [Bacteroidales bacterium]